MTKFLSDEEYAERVEPSTNVPSINATEQAGQQVNPQTTPTPTQPQQPQIPEGRFLNPKDVGRV